jgi:hypothetical protein
MHVTENQLDTSEESKQEMKPMKNEENDTPIKASSIWNNQTSSRMDETRDIKEEPCCGH